MRRRVRLTESDLHRIVKESVRRIINEIGDTTKGQYMLGRLSQRKGEPLSKNFYSDGEIGAYARHNANPPDYNDSNWYEKTNKYQRKQDAFLSGRQKEDSR